MPDLTSAQSQPIEELPTLANKELLKRYRTRLDGAKQWREQEGYDDVWKRLRALYRLKHFETNSTRDRIAVAISFATVNVILPSVAVSHPKFTVWASSEDPDLQAKAIITEGVSNYWWRHHRFTKQWKRIVKDFLVYGHGWGKTTWRYEERDGPRPEEEVAAEFEAAVAQANDYAAANPAEAGSLPTDAEILGSIEQTASQVVEDRPVFERISPFDMFVDPEATSLEDARWVVQRIVRPVEEVKQDKRYNARARRRLSGDGSVQWHNEEHKSKPSSEKEDTDRITLWEFYDLARELVSVFATSGDGFLVDPEAIPKGYQPHPFIQLRNYEVPDQFYPIGELEAIEPLQHELNSTRSGMVEARQLDIPKYLYRRAAFGTDAVKALSSSTPYTRIPIDTDEPFSELIAPLPRNEVSVQLYQHSDQIESDVEYVSAVSEYQRGATPETRKTATEASIIQDNANARASEKLDIIEQSLAEVGQRLIALGQAYMTGEQAARIGNDQGAAVYWSFGADDITGEFDFEIEAGSTQPRNETFRRQQEMQLLNTLAPFLGTGQVNDLVVIVHVLREGFGIKTPERFLGPLAGVMPGMPPPPEE